MLPISDKTHYELNKVELVPGILRGLHLVWRVHF